MEPALIKSINICPEDKAHKTKQNEMIYKAELDKSMKREDKYNKNLLNTYSLLWECYAKAIQNKIIPRSNNEDKIY